MTTRVWIVVLASVHWQQQSLSTPNLREQRDASAIIVGTPEVATWSDDYSRLAGIFFRLNVCGWPTLSNHVDVKTRVWIVVLASIHWELQTLSTPSLRQSRDPTAIFAGTPKSVPVLICTPYKPHVKISITSKSRSIEILALAYGVRYLTKSVFFFNNLTFASCT